MRYGGPIIDAHHHLWDLSLGRHPWLLGDAGALKSLGDLSFLQHDYLVGDYLRDVGPQNIVGSVYIEAVWDRARPVDEEVRWLESLQRPRNIASRCIAWAPLASPDLPGALAALAEHDCVVGVRETIRWHPDPGKRWAEAGLIEDPAWRQGAALLAKQGLMVEFLLNPYQADEVARLAHDLPDLTIVLNHCGTPVDRDAEGLARWRTGLLAMAHHPNVVIKLSNYGAYGVDKSLPALRDVVMTCIDAFGPRRAMFGTDYPVGRRAMSFQDACERFKDIAEAFTAEEQRDLFHDTAARYYRFPAA